MTDVVKIAKECRETLVAEIAKLDDFLAMAEKLMKFKNLSRPDGRLDDDADEATELTNSARVPPYSAAAGANGVDPKS